MQFDEAPESWLQLEKLLMEITEEQPGRLAMPVSELEGLVQDKQIDVSRGSIKTALAFMHGLGVALHFTERCTASSVRPNQRSAVVLSDWVFFNMNRLARIMRAIFRHDHQSHLCYRNFESLPEARSLGEERFRLMAHYFLESAVLAQPLLSCMLSLEGVDCLDDVDALGALLERLGLSYDIPLIGVPCDDSRGMNVQCHFIPFFCRLEESGLEKLWPKNTPDRFDMVVANFSVVSTGEQLPAGNRHARCFSDIYLNNFHH